jgi:hypothetical protein
MFVALLANLQSTIPPLSPQLLESIGLVLTGVIGVGLGIGVMMFGLTLLMIIGTLLQRLAQNMSRIFAAYRLLPVPSRTTVPSKRNH